MYLRQLLAAEIRVYDQLFAKEDPSEGTAGASYLTNLNPDSLEVIAESRLEPSLATAQPSGRFNSNATATFA